MSKRNKSLDYQIKKKPNYYIVLQICKAITLLHNFNPTILCEDIKPSNILIINALTDNIFDFRLAMKCDVSSALDTHLYMAPEILIDYLQGTLSIDIWSLICCNIGLFTKKCVWSKPTYSLPNFKKIVQTQTKPRFKDVPMRVEDTLKMCV